MRKIAKQSVRLQVIGKASLAAICLGAGLATPITVSAADTSPGILAIGQSQRQVTGNVTDTKGEPVIGATISWTVNGKVERAVSDFDGNFKFYAPVGDFTFEVAYLGFTTQQVTAQKGKANFKVVMSEDAANLEEVVVVGYGTQKKMTVTGAVSMIDTKELTQSPQANVSNLLVGRMPGLLAVQRSGRPGEDASTLRIRGVGTFAEGDGVQDPLIMVDGIETNNYNDIDPNEIESLTILKDASSTAVYGVRGANGVILITTKRGKTGKPVISYSGNVAMTQFTELRDPMNAYEYATSFNEARRYDAYLTGGYTPRFTDEEIQKYRDHSDPVLYPDINWYDFMLRKHSFTTQHNVNVSGGTEHTKYFVSAGYYNQQGLLRQTDLISGYHVQPAYDRFNFRSNLDFTINKYLTIKMNLATQLETKKGAVDEKGNTFRRIAETSPMAMPGVIDGKIVDLGSNQNNPITPLYNDGYRKDYRNHMNLSVTANFKVPGVEGLDLRSTLSYESYYQHFQSYRKDQVEAYTVMRDENGELFFQPHFVPSYFSPNEYFGKNRRTYFEFGVNYATTIAKNHNISALALYNQSRRNDPNLAYKVPNSYQGLVMRLTYDYKSRYLVEFNAGYNGTENFAPGKRFGFFPAYSLGWVVSEEPFFPKTPVLDYLKIRASYGEVGNDKIGGQRFLYLPTTYVSGPSQYYFGEVGKSYNKQNIVSEGKIGNPDLTWERAKKLNIGLEANFWDNHIHAQIDFFNEKRNNILANMNSAPTIFGGQLPTMNMGKMKNSGYDADLTIRGNVTQSLYLWGRANYTYAHNKIEYMDEVPNTYSYKNKTGQSYGQYFGLICDGIYNTWEEVNPANRPISSWNNNMLQPGDLIYRDVNGDGIINNDDEVPIGYSNFPEITYGLSFGGNWKGLDLSVLFQGAEHVSLLISGHDRMGFIEDKGASRELLKSWTQERYEKGMEIEYPHLSEGNAVQKHNYATSNFWVRDASYIRLKNIELGYTFTGKALAKLKMQSIRLYINGNNLITWDSLPKGTDPETAQQSGDAEPYPITKTYNFGVNIKF